MVLINRVQNWLLLVPKTYQWVYFHQPGCGSPRHDSAMRQDHSLAGDARGHGSAPLPSGERLVETPDSSQAVEPAISMAAHQQQQNRASIQISLNKDSTPKLSPHLSKTRQPTVLARIQPQLIFIHSYSSRTLHGAVEIRKISCAWMDPSAPPTPVAKLRYFIM